MTLAATPLGYGLGGAFHDDDGRIHGTRGAYANGCRCDACTRASRDYARGRRAKTRTAEPVDDLRWAKHGACSGHPTLSTDAWFPTQGPTLPVTERAIAVCQTCPVRIRCEQYGRQHHQYGIWGGQRLHGRPVDAA